MVSGSLMRFPTLLGAALLFWASYALPNEKAIKPHILYILLDDYGYESPLEGCS